ncbi:hypothetical protein [Mesorhizobium sp. AR07]|uniref:hypothetical protein n=1 Tax=Mesorhizobium sp. AR07 TaxID=2865838 RepID=UPI00215EE94D|nr:hypothetical protein [Mesorhizobium sp. AR07]
MLAYVSHLIVQSTGVWVVSIHPNGENAGKGFVRVLAIRTTLYGGQYRQGEHTIIVNPSSSRGDVVAKLTVAG